MQAANYLICATLILGGSLILYTSNDTELYAHKLKRIEHFTTLPVGNATTAYTCYLLCGILYCASGILLLLKKRAGKITGITGTVLFCLIFDNPLTHIQEDIFVMKAKMAMFHIVVIGVIASLPISATQTESKLKAH